jgi:sulfur carrier protein
MRGAPAVAVKVEHKGKIEELQNPKTVKNLLKMLNLNENEVLVSVNGELATEDTVIKDGDSVKIIDVISGG